MCSRYGLAIGAAVAPVVRVLVWICYPVAYPISKVIPFDSEHLAYLQPYPYLILQSSTVDCYSVIFQLLDFMLGDGHVALFRRAELKTLVNLHGNEVCPSYLHSILT